MHFQSKLITYALIATSAASLVKRQDGDDSADSSSGGDGGCMVACEAAANEAVEGHCDNSTWTGYLDSCLNCANTAGFASDYETEVQSNAGDCGIEAQFLPSAVPDGDDMDDGLPDSDSMPDTGPEADEADSSPDSDMPDTGPEADEDDSSPDSEPAPTTSPAPSGTTGEGTTPSETGEPDSSARSLGAPLITTGLVGVLAALFAYAL